MSSLAVPGNSFYCTVKMQAIIHCCRPEDEKEEESSEEEDDDKRRLNDELLGKVVYVDCNGDKIKGWYPALVSEYTQSMVDLFILASCIIG